VEDLGLAGEDLELGVVERQLSPEVLDLAGDHDLAADRQPALDEPPAEPRRVDAAGVVLQPGDRALDPSPKARLDPHVTHGGLH